MNSPPIQPQMKRNFPMPHFQILDGVMNMAVVVSYWCCLRYIQKNMVVVLSLLEYKFGKVQVSCEGTFMKISRFVPETTADWLNDFE